MTIEPGQIPKREPLAYFLTWTTYGTWLPGDERGWFEKPGQFRAPDAQRRENAKRLMTEPALTLEADQRCLVENTITDHCRIRGWHLHAVAARTQHVHVVVTAPGRDPEVVMEQFKAWCTRRLKQLERKRCPAKGKSRHNFWTQGGSKVWLNDDKSLEEKMDYVLNRQGEPTPGSSVNGPLA
jgi:REP element-mobilizing transposase RayT